MIYQVLVEKQVQKTLEKIPPPFYTQIKRSILQLAHNPRPVGYIKLKNRDGYRIRIGEYRVIYDIKDKTLTVLVQ